MNLMMEVWSSAHISKMGTGNRWERAGKHMIPRVGRWRLCGGWWRSAVGQRHCFAPVMHDLAVYVPALCRRELKDDRRSGTVTRYSRRTMASIYFGIKKISLPKSPLGDRQRIPSDPLKQNLLWVQRTTLPFTKGNTFESIFLMIVAGV
jgi:hypothetical protein